MDQDSPSATIQATQGGKPSHPHYEETSPDSLAHASPPTAETDEKTRDQLQNHEDPTLNPKWRPPIQVPPGMTKSQAKKQARMKAWQETKLERRAFEKERKKAKRAEERRKLEEEKGKEKEREASEERRAEGGKIEDGDGPARKRVRLSEGSGAGDSAAASAEPNGETKEGDGGRKRMRRKKSPFKANLLLDLGFDEMMTEREVSSLIQQISYLYHSNKVSDSPFERILLTGKGSRGDWFYASDPDRKAGKKASELGASGEKVRGEAEGEKAIPSIYEERLGKGMEGKMRGVWKKWKGFEIVASGGIEGLLCDDEDGDEGKEEKDGVEGLERNQERVVEGEGGQTEKGEVVKTDSEGKQEKGDGSSLTSTHEEQRRRTKLRRKDVVYLTADTDDTIEELEEGKTYIIGGIVDRNRYKNICAKKADDLGLRKARLPIDPVHLSGHMNSRQVLTVNQVVDILLGWVEKKDWKLALERGLPKRKFEDKTSARAEPEGTGGQPEGGVSKDES
ncbi:hypothetical protein IE53DRAFT_378041 [Violaceomyces palustris]|uniref:Uncharacterized protein n=1 Tax=Violaceomyces palustris TaxID=1673888 RepID=A0ACD0P3G1_9BASI|nr:hypothetical protein IE53DRAFT_378041 [Violaceomyces palustris]